jgi:GNAT superfamily N-acetyltransferase
MFYELGSVNSRRIIDLEHKMKIEIIPFHDDLIAQAGELLAARQRRDRSALPELPARFEDPQTAGAAVTALWQKPHTTGSAAIENDRLIGYLIGETVIDSLWGRSAWVRPAGMGLAAGQEAELMRRLYAATSARWVDYGIFFHFSVTPVLDTELIQAWFSLSFGIEQVHALLDLNQIDEQSFTLPAGLEIRRAGPQDREALASLSEIIWRHQVQGPVWGIHMPESEERQGWVELADDPTVTVWLAFLQGEAVASQGYFPSETSADDLLIPEHCARLTIAATRETMRGRGIQLALTRHGLLQARKAGYRFVETDWRSANLEAARFWPRQGFRPVAYRLVRRIDPRIAWARGEFELPQ